METRSDEVDADAAELLRAYIEEQAEAIRVGDERLRDGADAIHPTRVATRRLRSLVRVFGNAFERDAARSMDEDLAWYAGLLGGVRERQVLRARFAAYAARGAGQSGAAGTSADDALRAALVVVDQRLLAAERQGHDELMAALGADRYRSMLDTLASWRTEPPLRSDALTSPDRLLVFVRAAGRTADRRLAASTARRHDADDLHRARKAAKRARYAAEVARSVIGSEAARATIDRYKAVQESLGEHQDSADAVALLTSLREEARSSEPQLLPGYDELLRLEREAAGHALGQATTLTSEAPPPS